MAEQSQNEKECRSSPKLFGPSYGHLRTCPEVRPLLAERWCSVGRNHRGTIALLPTRNSLFSRTPLLFLHGHPFSLPTFYSVVSQHTDRSVLILFYSHSTTTIIAISPFLSLPSLHPSLWLRACCGNRFTLQQQGEQPHSALKLLLEVVWSSELRLRLCCFVLTDTITLSSATVVQASYLVLAPLVSIYLKSRNVVHSIGNLSIIEIDSSDQWN